MCESSWTSQGIHDRLSYATSILLLPTNFPILHSLLTIRVSSSANGTFPKSSIKCKINPSKVNFQLLFLLQFSFHVFKRVHQSFASNNFWSHFQFFILKRKLGKKSKLSSIPRYLSYSKLFLSMSHCKFWHTLFILATSPSEESEQRNKTHNSSPQFLP